MIKPVIQFGALRVAAPGPLCNGAGISEWEPS